MSRSGLCRLLEEKATWSGGDGQRARLEEEKARVEAELQTAKDERENLEVGGDAIGSRGGQSRRR